MKKFLSVLVIILLACSGCSRDKKTITPKTTTSALGSVITVHPTAPTAAPTTTTIPKSTTTTSRTTTSVVPTVSTTTIATTRTTKTTKKIPSVEEIMGKESNCTLLVNGKDISTQTYVYCSDDYFEIPVVAIIKELGGTVTWTGKYTAIIEHDGQSFILDTSADTVYKLDEWGYPIPLDLTRNCVGNCHFPDPKKVTRVLDECIMDHGSADSTIGSIFFRLSMWWDIETKTVTIQYSPQ